MNRFLHYIKVVRIIRAGKYRAIIVHRLCDKGRHGYRHNGKCW